VRVRLLLIGSVAALWCASTATALARVDWRIQPTPSPVGALSSALIGVSCPRFSSCVAVGTSQPTLSTGVTLAERWNGGSWEIEPTPNPAGAPISNLHSVSCPQPQACMAVGSYETPAFNDLTLAERWDGAGWQIEPTPTPSGPPSQGVLLDGVSCPETNECIAVGYATTAAGELSLAERWSGARWAILPTPNPTGSTFSLFGGVSCTSPNECIAVGSYFVGGVQRPLSERWQGHRWTIQDVPPPGGATLAALSDVSCASRRSCSAVGFARTSGNVYVPLAERWDGEIWRIQPTPNPPGATISSLSGVSCPSSGTCSAVGQFATTQPEYATLAERWTRRGWEIKPTLNPLGPPAAALTGVSCAETRACTAVGGYFTTPEFTTELPLAERLSPRPG
jgi:hypothetical protein